MNIKPKKIEKFSQIQKETLIGILLGDGHLETLTDGKTYRLCFGQNSKRSQYIQMVFEIFENWIDHPLKKRICKNTKSSSEYLYFRTRFSSSFRFYALQFYKEKEKCVPKLISRWLTPRALAFWYMDDGSLKSHQSKGVILNTHCFSFSDVNRLCIILNTKYNLLAKSRIQYSKNKEKKSYQIFISGKSLEVLRELITPYFSEDIWYKFLLPRKARKDKPLPRKGKKLLLSKENPLLCKEKVTNLPKE